MASLTTPEPPEAVEPVVSHLALEVQIPLRVLAVGIFNPSLAVIDFQTGTTSAYPPGALAFSLKAADGAVMTPNREIGSWRDGIARLLNEALDSVDVELGPSPPRSLDGIAPALRVVPTPDGQRAWLVQPGLGWGTHSDPTLAELIELPTGRRLQSYETDPNAFPVAATNAGLVLNTHLWFDTGDGFTTEPGTERVLHLLQDGSLLEIGEGRAIAASSDTIIRLVCPPSDQPECGEPFHNHNLVLSNLDGTGPRTVTPPSPGRWLTVGGPSIPTSAMPLQTVSPDGSKLLIGHSKTLDVNSAPTDSLFLIVDLNDGTSTTVADLDGLPPLANRPSATWSMDGQWIALLFFDGDIRLIDAHNPDMTFTLSGVIPQDHYPLAAG